jgi:hypothetical protein
VFACDVRGDCKWFTGCVLSGYQASDCPPTDVCCHEDWPFAETLAQDDQIAVYFSRWGLAPWDSRREANMTVAVEAGLSADVSAVRCMGDLASIAGTPCGRVPDVELARGEATLEAWMRGPRDLAGWDLLLEVISDGSARGRLCRLPYSDGAVRSCTTARQPRCAAVGELLVNTVDPTAATAISFSASFSDGVTVDGELAL